MIAVNWFEVFPKETLISVPLQQIEEGEPVPSPIRTLAHRTKRVTQRYPVQIVHITKGIPEGTTLELYSASDHPDILKFAIEHGFGMSLKNAGFNVRLCRVGLEAHKITQDSILENVYRTYEGTRFRCWFGFYDQRRRSHRWGMIINYSRTQAFRVTLSDTVMQRLAVGKGVTPLEEETSSSASLVGIRSGRAILRLQDGQEIEDSLDNWTLPCNRSNLMAYAKERYGKDMAAKVSLKLDQDALVLTTDRRLNAKLARDQLESVQRILGQELLSFPLMLPHEPLARIDLHPLQVGEDL